MNILQKPLGKLFPEGNETVFYVKILDNYNFFKSGIYEQALCFLSQELIDFNHSPTSR